MIYFFSGTGNSRAVAYQLSKHLDMGVVDIANIDFVPDFKGEDVVVWVFPIYAWGLPPILEDFIEMIETTSTAQHYMVCTCGDDIGRADRQWEKLLRRKGMSPRAAFSVQMPNIYTLLPGFDVDDYQIEDKKLALMPKRVEEVAEAIRRGESKSGVVAGKFARLKSAVVYPIFRAYGCSARPFQASEYCKSCGLCAAHCPKGNITMVDGRPQWGDDCTMCLRCYHICHYDVVSYGRMTKGKSAYRTLMFKNLQPIKKNTIFVKTKK